MGYKFTQYSYKTGVDVSVVQSTGTSKVDVMSQDATTRELNSVKRALNKSASALVELQNGIITPVGNFQTDSSVAYVKNVPEIALPYAELKKVGGRTVKTGGSNNLLPYPYSETTLTRDGISFFDNGDGSISIDGTAEDSVVFVLASGGMSFGSQDLSCKGTFAGANGYVISNPSSNVTFAYYAETGECLLTIAEGTTVIQETVYPMVNAGTSPLEWEPYSAGTLRSALVTEVESVGENVFGGIALSNRIKEVNPNATVDTSAKTVSYYAGGISDKVLFTSFKPNTRYTFIWKGYADAKFLNLIVIYTDGTRGDLNKFAESNKVGTIRFVSDASKSIRSLNGIWYDGSTTLYYDECGIFEGDVQIQDFKPYFNHTLPIPVEVRGSMNIWDEEWYLASLIETSGEFYATSDGHVCSKNYIAVLPNTKYYKNILCWVAFYGKNKEFISANSLATGVLTTPSNCYFLKFQTISSDYGLVYKNDIMINAGTTALPYEPYSTETGLDGYGLGVSDTVYSYIDLEKKQFVKKCPMVDLGTLNWEYETPYSRFVGTMPSNYKIPATYEERFALLSAIYATHPSPTGGEYVNMTITGYEGSNQIYINNASYTDVASFKAAMSGVMLIYESATPEVTDISQYFTDDDVDVMKVGAGGTITFKNGYADAVPSEIEYQVGV